MKNSKGSKALIWASAIVAGALMMGAGPAGAQDGILYKLRFGNSNYCHLKFPAITDESLSSDRPLLQDPSTGEIVDFYGPCDFDPTGKAAVQEQRRVKRRGSLDK